MGAAHVKAVYAWWPDLPPAPKVLLLYMALRARDSEPVPRYWGGREDLAYGAGYRLPDKSTDADKEAERGMAFRAVRRTIKDLIRVRAVSVVVVGRKGQPTVYELHLNGE